MEMVQKSVQAKLRKQLEKAKMKAQHELMKQQRANALQMRRKLLQEERDRDRLEKQERSKYLLEVSFWNTLKCKSFYYKSQVAYG